MNTKVAAVLLMGTILVASSHSANGVSRSDSLVYGETGRLDRFDPYTIHEASGHRLSDLIFDGLVSPAPGGTYEPALAKSWDVRSAGTEVLVTIKEGITWHRDEKDSSARHVVDSDDVIATVRAIKNPSSDIPNRERFSVIKSVRKIGRDKVLFVFDRAMIDPLRFLMFKILPEHKLSQTAGLSLDSDFVKRPIGTGPYQFQKYSKTGEILLRRNEEYYGRKPKFKAVVMKSYADQNIMAQSLMFGALDMVTYVSPRSLDEVVGDKRLKTVPYDALSYSFIAFNHRRSILGKREVRQALSQAVNRAEMLEAFFMGRGKLVSGPFAPTSWAYNIDVENRAFSPESAKKNLEKAGLTDTNRDGVFEFEGRPISLKFVVPISGESEILKRIALAYQGYLADVGIPVELDFQDWNVWKKKILKDHDFDLTVASWSFDDAANVMSLFHSNSIKPWGNNFIGYSNPAVDSLLTEIASTSDFDKKRLLSHKLHETLALEAPYTFLWTLEHNAAHHSQVKGVSVEPFAFFRYLDKWKKDSDSK